MKELIDAIIRKHKDYGIEVNEPVGTASINVFERHIGFPLPEDFKVFYSICNGFSCIEDIFNILPLSTIRNDSQNYGTNWFYFSEYMIYSDMWGLRYTLDGKYEIFNGSYPTFPMTSSLVEFLTRYLNGNVFDEGGLYEWQDELDINKSN